MATDNRLRYIANTTLALNTFLVLNNANALVRPRSALRMLGFNAPVSPADQMMVDGLMRMFAATRMVLGLTGMAMWWYEEYRGLGSSLVFGALMGSVDG